LLLFKIPVLRSVGEGKAIGERLQVSDEQS
jgi:hypothetical protein